MKKGRFSEEEVDFLKRNAESMTYEEMAKVMDRDVVSVQSKVENYIGKNISESKSKALTAQFDIKKTVIWTDICSQFSKDEQNLFLYHWGRLVSQFREDIFPTEELQIVTLVKVEILIDRILKEQFKNTENIRTIEEELIKEKNKDLVDQDMGRIMELDKTICFARSAQSEMSREYRELLNKQKDSLKDLKATREQRVKRLEDSKQTFVGWMMTILSDTSLRKELGLKMQKHRMAAEKEAARLGEYHEYADNILDRPLLNCDSVLQEGKENDV